MQVRLCTFATFELLRRCTLNRQDLVRGGARYLEKNNLRVTDKKYYEIHVVVMDKAIDLCTVLLDRKPHKVERQSLCGSEVT